MKTAVDGWAAKMKNNRQSTPGQKSQAAFVRQELAEAARLSHAAVAAAVADEASFDKGGAGAGGAPKRAHGGAMRDLLKREADADFVNLQFDAALALYRRVLGADRSQGRSRRAGRRRRSTWRARSTSWPTAPIAAAPSI